MYTIKDCYFSKKKKKIKKRHNINKDKHRENTYKEKYKGTEHQYIIIIESCRLSGRGSLKVDKYSDINNMYNLCKKYDIKKIKKYVNDRTRWKSNKNRSKEKMRAQRKIL